MELTEAHRIALGKIEIRVQEAYERVVEAFATRNEDLFNVRMVEAVEVIAEWVCVFARQINEFSGYGERIVSVSDEKRLLVARGVILGSSIMQDRDADQFIDSARPEFMNISYEPIYPH